MISLSTFRSSKLKISFNNLFLRFSQHRPFIALLNIDAYRSIIVHFYYFLINIFFLYEIKTNNNNFLFYLMLSVFNGIHTVRVCALYLCLTYSNILWHFRCIWPAVKTHFEMTQWYSETASQVVGQVLPSSFWSISTLDLF